MASYEDFFFLCVLYSLSYPLGHAELPLGSPPAQRGMALGLFSKDPMYDYHSELAEMKAHGITHILLVVSWYQKNIYANVLEPLPYDQKDSMTIPDHKLIEVIEQAHQLELKTFIFPIVRLLERKDGQWRGTIEPKNLDLWFQSYENFIAHYATIAKDHGVFMLSVGSELGNLEDKKDYWEKLIINIRKIFPGKLIYSANWDHYQHTTFWKNLDHIGITAYYELTKSKNPDYTKLINSWKEIRLKILQWKKKYNQDLIFTEIGYPSFDGANIYPWNYFSDNPVDLEEQALCYRSFARTWGNTPGLAGVYFWVWWGKGGTQDKSYTPKGKPAADVLKQWYQ